MNVMITGIAHLCLSVSDLAKMEDFYAGKLGLAKAFDFVNDQGHRFGLYLKLGRRTFIELFEGRDLAAGAQNAAYRHVCLEVDDIVATVETLRARGVEATDPKLGSDHAWQSWIKDPEGNAIELHAYTPQSWQTPHV